MGSTGRCCPAEARRVPDTFALLAAWAAPLVSSDLREFPPEGRVCEKPSVRSQPEIWLLAQAPPGFAPSAVPFVSYLIPADDLRLAHRATVRTFFCALCTEHPPGQALQVLSGGRSSQKLQTPVQICALSKSGTGVAAEVAV